MFQKKSMLLVFLIMFTQLASALLIPDSHIGEQTSIDKEKAATITSSVQTQTIARTAGTEAKKIAKQEVIPSEKKFTREKRVSSDRDKAYTTKIKEATGESTIQQAALKKAMQTQKMIRENMNFVDKALPVVVASHTLYPPDTKFTVTINAEAYDNREVDIIKIYVDSKLKQTCQVKAGSGTCVFTETFQNAGSHSYFVEALDSSQNKGLYPKKTTVKFKTGLEQNAPRVTTGVNRPGGKKKTNIVARAKDDTKVDIIRIIFGDPYNLGPQVTKKECTINAQEGECIYFPDQVEVEYNYYYKAVAYDIWGNYGSSGWKMTRG